MKPRDYHKLAIIKREVRGFTSKIPSKRAYKRHPKHKAVHKDG